MFLSLFDCVDQRYTNTGNTPIVLDAGIETGSVPYVVVYVVFRMNEAGADIELQTPLLGSRERRDEVAALRGAQVRRKDKAFPLDLGTIPLCQGEHPYIGQNDGVYPKLLEVFQPLRLCLWLINAKSKLPVLILTVKKSARDGNLAQCLNYIISWELWLKPFLMNG